MASGAERLRQRALVSSLRYCSQHKGFNKKTPLLPGTGGRSGVFDIRGISTDDNQPVAGNILTNKTVERLYDKKKRVSLFCARLFVTFATPNLLALGNEKKSPLFFCISLVFS